MAEAAALLLLLRRNRSVEIAAGASLAVIASRLETAIEASIREARALGRRAGTERIRAEADSAGVSLAAALLAPAARMLRDATRARHFAARYARAWLTAAQGSNPVQAANAATAGRLATVGLTEGAAAFNESRRDHVRLLPHLMRMWDSVNDKRTCQKCAAAHGTIVGANEPFPLGEPGAVHPRCLCSWHLLTVDELIFYR